MARQLVRDPYTRLGGVASGLSYHYGIDVSLIRLAFVLFTLMSGFGLLAYVLAWLIIPRAEYWPPVGGGRPSQSVSSRELAVGLLLLGAMIGLFFSGGVLPQILVPLALVGAGAWLLAQPAAGEEPGTVVGTPPSVAPVAPVAPVDTVDTVDAFDAGLGPDTSGFGLDDTVRPDSGELPPGTPVPRRSRRWLAVLVGAVVLLVILPILLVVGLVVALFSSGFDPGSERIVPDSVAAIPDTIEHGQGELVVDLTRIEPSDYEGDPIPIEIDLDVGEIRVILPAGVTADVDAASALGDVRVFGSSDEGFRAEVSIPQRDPDLELDISLGIGQVVVERR